jgi:hypothetical protein
LSSDVGAGSSFVMWLPMVEQPDPTVVSGDGIHPIHDPLLDAE